MSWFWGAESADVGLEEGRQAQMVSDREEFEKFATGEGHSLADTWKPTSWMWKGWQAAKLHDTATIDTYKHRIAQLEKEAEEDNDECCQVVSNYEASIDKYEKRLALIERKFTSGNDIPVDMIRITRKEWEGVK